MNKFKKSRIAYFISGLLLSLLSMYLSLNWMDIIPYKSYDEQPKWLQFINEYLVGGFPWFIFAILIVFRFIQGNQIKVGAYFLGAALPILLLVSYMLTYPAVENYQHQQKFDALLWQTQTSNITDTSFPPRLSMIDDLISSNQLIGLSKQEAVALLGEPEPQGFPWINKENYIHYYLGPERGFISIDSEWLVITFDQRNIVNGYWIMKD